MRNRTWFGRIVTFLLVAMLLAVGATGSAQDDKSVKDKVAQLEKQLKELEAVVKSLSIELQKLTQAGTGEIENIRPRLFAVEQLAKDLSFDLKKLSGRISTVEGMVEKLAELPQQVADLRYSVGEIASRTKANELAISQLRDQLEKLAGMQALVINLQGTVGALSNRVETIEKGLAALTDQVGKLQALVPLVNGLQDTTANLSVRVGRIEETLVKHSQQLEQLSSVPGVVVTIQSSVGELASRISSLEGNFARLQDIVTRLQEMVSKLSGRLDAAEARDEETAKKLGQLTDGFSKILIDIESLKLKINELQDRIARLGALQPSPPVEIPDVKALVQQAVAEKTKELQAQVAQAKKEAQEAKAAVEGANSLALIALVAGLAGVLIGFLF
ncbi:MAG: hypothetical protein NZ930_01685 [Candidatus Bipolaricaulota bacterium]|nr:hypothetical protein [Candidatus Bipolaricaulota bacterium]MDW8030215.1 hypothetical protein [Candidatus Bipolaricaulota bacterium]